MTHQPHALKCRPNTFSEVIWQSHVVESLANAIRMGHIPQCLLLTGTRGVGKTTIGRIFAKCLNCLAHDTPSPEPCLTCDHCLEIQAGRFPDFFEIDAASHTKVDQIRELQETLPYAPSKGRYKVYLIDEVHMLSKSSFNALLKTLEEPPPHVIFMLATTDPQKLPATILSRCLQFHLQAMPKEAIAEHLIGVLTKEFIQHDDKAIMQIAQAAKGSMRDAFSLLDQCLALGNGSISADTVNTMLGTIDKTPLIQLLQALSQQQADAVFEQVNHLRRSGACLASALAELAQLLQHIARLQLVTPLNPDAEDDQLRALADAFDPETTQLLYQIAIHGQRDLAYAPSLDCGFEMTLLRMLSFTHEPQATAPTAPPIKQRAPAPSRPSTPSAAPSPAHTPSASNTSQDLNTYWLELAPQLQLRGLAMVLAKGCTLVSNEQSPWQFTLEKKQAPVLQHRTEKALADALSAHFGQAIAVNITLVDQSPPVATAQKPNNPVKKQSPTRETRAPAKTVSQETDNPELKRIMDTFSATIVDSTVVR